MKPASPFSLPNVRLFIIFRVLANARYYYPVMAKMFLDLGLTLTQFNLLNAIWAATIVLAEVPSGAMADIVGRRNLVLLAALLMTVEMVVLLVAPIDGGWMLFTLVAINRIASGLGEASASGADEAVAFDTLQEKGLEAQWPRVLDILARWSAVGFFVAMILGGLVYDLTLVNTVWQALGGSEELTRADIVKIPIWMTLIHALVVALAALRMKEPESFERQPMRWAAVRGAFQQMARAGQWTLQHRFVLFVIIAGVLLDAFGRQLAVLGSEYLSIIGYPPSMLGFIFAGLALLGFFYGRIGRFLVTHRSPVQNLLLLSGCMLAGLLGLGFALPYVGLLFYLLCTSALNFVGFFHSHYLNREVDSKQRATVLSFKGLAINLGYGAIGLAHVAILAGLQLWFPDASQDVLLTRSFFAFPVLFILGLAVLLLAGRHFIRRQEKITAVG
ncbi:MAG: MFS transporter [Verrucomicrobiota bacterium JB022]|nr:MFS transporter [Verrucomicrobiota bacterium JB022]